MEEYLNISRAKDLKNPKERFLYRCLEIFPGLLSWGASILAFFLSAFAPVAVAIFIILFDLYWLLKIIYLSFHQIVCFSEMKKNIKVNWFKKVSQLPDWQKIYHLIILPFYKEEKEIIERSLEALLQVEYPKEKLIVVLTGEERGGKTNQKIIKEIEKKYSNKFFNFLTTIHPKNLEGEITGKGSNVAWAIKEAKRKIILPLKIPPENIIVSNFDIDTKPFPQYFACLTFYYLTTKKPQRASYQPIPIYNNNIWLVPAFSRIIATSGTFWQMMQQERPEILVTFSSHSLPFLVLEKIDYPKNVVSDDSRIFWKSYFFYNGDYRVIPLHYPVSMDAVLSENLKKTIINQYKQQRRWAWGCKDIPFLIFSFLKNKKISLSEKIHQLIVIIDGFWSWATSSLLIFFLGWLPLVLGGEKFNISLFAYNLPRLTSNLMTIAMAGMIISGVLSFLILPPKPKNSNSFNSLSMVLQWLLLPVTLIFFGAFPALDAQTRLMLGKHLEFWPTEKKTIEKL